MNMNPEGQFTRTPKPIYEGKNGFLKNFTEPEEINEGNLQNALEMHRMAEYMMKYKQRPVPDFETMKADVESPDDPEKRLKALRQDHLDDLQRFYAVIAQEYKQEATDAYLSKDDNWLSDGAMSEGEKKLLEMYDNWFGEFKVDPTDPSKRFNLIQTKWQGQYEQIRYAYLTQLIPLEKAKRDFEINQEQLRIQRVKMFPQSKADFESKPPDARLRVARFLLADRATQEKQLNKFSWAWRQVEPLIDIFKKDLAFAADIRGVVLSADAVSDPRRARPA